MFKPIQVPKQKKLVQRINIKGNNITNEDVIRSELILDEGDPFSKLNVEKSIAAFNKVCKEMKIIN